MNPAAPDGGIDIELLQTLPGFSLGATFKLEKPDGTVVATVGTLAGSAGAFFPQTASLYKLFIPRVPAGDYVVRATTQWLDTATSTQGQVDATMPLTIQRLQLDYIGFKYTPGFIVGGTSRIISLRLSSAAPGKVYIYAKGAPRDLCDNKSAADLAALSSAAIFNVTGGTSSASQTYLAGTSFADADTACVQFVDAGTGLSEKPYSYNLRYMSLPTSGDALLPLDVAGSTDKAGFALVSMPPSTTDSGAYDFLARRQVFAHGDVHEQSTSNSARITLEQDSSGWLYRLGTPLASDHPVYLASVEGKAPLMVYLKP